jgi:hypothetical protein
MRCITIDHTVSTEYRRPSRCGFYAPERHRDVVHHGDTRISVGTLSSAYTSSTRVSGTPSSGKPELAGS